MVRIPFLCVAVTLLGACGNQPSQLNLADVDADAEGSADTAPGASVDLEPTSDLGPPSIGISPSELSIAAGGEAVVTIERGNTDGATTCTVGGLPSWLTAAGGKLGDGASSTTLTFHANADADIYTTVKASIACASSAASLAVTSTPAVELTLDSSFAQKGIRSYPGTDWRFGRGYVLPDGRVRVEVNGSAILALNADGTVDETFGDGGTIGNLNGWGTATLLPGGDSYVGLALNSDAMILHLDANGAPDESFGQNGIATLPVGVAYYPYFSAVGTGGSIYVIAFSPSMSAARMCKLSSAGVVATTFGSDGCVDVDIHTTNNIHAAAADDRVLMEESTGVAQWSRLTSDGKLDLTFGVIGHVGAPSENAVLGTLDGAGYVVAADAPFSLRYYGVDGHPSGDGIAPLELKSFVPVGVVAMPNGDLRFVGSGKSGTADRVVVVGGDGALKAAARVGDRSVDSVAVDRTSGTTWVFGQTATGTFAMRFLP